MVRFLSLPVGVSLPVIMLLVTALLWINTDVLYGQVSQVVRDRILLLGLMFAIAFATVGGRVRMQKPFSLMRFAIFLAATLVATIFLDFVIPGEIVANTEPLATLPIASFAIPGGILLLSVLAYYEEQIFRNIFLNTRSIGVVLSSVMFGLLHISALIAQGFRLSSPLNAGSLLPSLGLLIVLGFIWSYVATEFGFDAAVASHIGWNIGVLGVF